MQVEKIIRNRRRYAATHEPVGDFQDSHVASALARACSNLKADKTAADHNDILAVR